MMVRAKEGDTVELPCAAQGHPVPEYMWFNNGLAANKIRSSKKILLLSGSLYLYNVAESDSSTYSCIVNNSVGTEVVRTNLIVSASLTAFVEPQTQTVNAGNEAALKCTATGYPIKSVSWVHNGKLMKTLKGKSSTILKIPAVSRKHSGMYQCIASNHQSESQGTSELKLGNAVPVVVNGFEGQILQPGPSLTLTCTFSGNPRPWITWFVDETAITRRQSKFFMDDRVIDNGLVEARLNISNVKTEDGGLYSCRGSNGRGKTKHSAMLNVFGIPGVRDMKNVSAVAGSTIRFRCHTTGYPIESITWLRDGSLLWNSSRHRIFENGSLLIKDASPNIDNAQYICLVRNKHNSAQGSLWVSIKVKPKVEEISSKIAEEGQTVTLMCSVSVGDRPISKHWVKDGNAIPQDLGITITEANVFSALVINSIQQVHSGNYTCIATNQVGSDNKTASIRVKVPAMWLFRPLNKTVQEMSSVFFHCSGSGYPTPIVKWFKVRKPGVKGIKQTDKFNLFKNGTLLIFKVSSSDEGEYKCKIGNGLSNEKSASVYLKVGAPPNVSFASRSIISAVYMTVNMDCKVVGSSPISVKWRRNNRIINLIKDVRLKTRRFPFSRGLKSQLQILNVKNSDQGTYSCTAKNKFGKHSDSLVLNILTVPNQPTDLQIESNMNGSMGVFWKHDMNFGLPIIQFILQIKKDSDSWKRNAKNISIPGRHRHALIAAERFAKNEKYRLRVIARNRIGIGEPSKEMLFQATETGYFFVEMESRKNGTLLNMQMKTIIIICTSLVLFVVLIIIFICVLSRRRKTQNDQPKGLHKSCTNSKSADFESRSLSELDQYGKLISMSTITPGGENDRPYEPIRNNYCPDIYYDDVSPYATFQVTNPSQNDAHSPKKPKELSTFQQGSYSNHEDNLSQIY